MVAIADLTDDEAALYALMMDDTGIDQAEFLWEDPKKDDGLFRLRDYQWPMFNDQSRFVAHQDGRNVGKSLNARMKGFIHPFIHKGRDMLVTAPELNHLQPLISEIEDVLMGHWLTRGMMLVRAGAVTGIKRQPAWECQFQNGAKIISRLPGKTGRGILGQHVTTILQDESQQYPEPGWTHLVECLNSDEPDARWYVYGVSQGVRDQFYTITTDPNSGWSVHRWSGVHRPTWSDEERQQKILQYGGEDDVEYKRNIFGDHGDASSTVFVLHRLMACTDTVVESEYNSDVYHNLSITAELHERLGTGIEHFLQSIPASHKNNYDALYGGMDVGWVRDPSELLIFGHPKGNKGEMLELLLRVSLKKISGPNQARVVRAVFAHYGGLLKSFALDATGAGLPVYQWLQEEEPSVARRIVGYGYSEKVPVAFDEAVEGTPEEQKVMMNAMDYGVDVLRRMVDLKQIKLPFDRELLSQWQGRTRSIGAGFKSSGYTYSRGAHTLDGALMMILPKALAAVNQVLDKPVEQPDVLDSFIMG